MPRSGLISLAVLASVTVLQQANFQSRIAGFSVVSNHGVSSIGYYDDGLVMSDRYRRCGYVAIVGKPNVGKSTLLNRLVGTKISLVAGKPQSTRHNITGICTQTLSQMVFVDTPGIHFGAKSLLNQVLNKSAVAALDNVDLVLFVVDKMSWRAQDDYVLELIKAAAKPCLLCINKADELKDKQLLLPLIAALSQKAEFVAIVPISARTGDNLEALKLEIIKRLPKADFLFDEEQISNRSEQFIVAELIREQLVRITEDELPYSIYVELERYAEDTKLVNISATVWVEKKSQRAIVIGKQGTRLKQVGVRARKSIERFLGKRIYLSLWVKHKANWQDNPEILSKFDSGYI